MTKNIYILRKGFRNLICYEYILINPNIITSIIHPKFVCELCNFKCSKKGDYNRHISTDKHKLLTNTNTLASKNITFNCDCGKVYKHMPTLCAHK